MIEILVYIVISLLIAMFPHTPPRTEEVYIMTNSVRVPVGYIVLVRRDSEYCSVKFTEIKIGRTIDDWIYKYESYYQGDKTGNLTNENVQFVKGKLLATRQNAIIKIGSIQCGPIKLGWENVGWIKFSEFYQEEGDYGIELAPTIWTEVSQVNLEDQRLKWFGFDPKREEIKIPIDKFWEENSS